MSNNIIISGATGNLGREVVKKLSDCGNNIYVTLSSKNINVFGKFPDVKGQVVDLLDYDASVNFVNQTLIQAKSVQAGIFLAGGYASGSINETDDAALQKMFNLNFLTAFHLVKPLMEHLRKTEEVSLFLSEQNLHLLPARERITLLMHFPSHFCLRWQNSLMQRVNQKILRLQSLFLVLLIP